MSKQFWGVIAVIILIFLGVFLIGGGKSNAPGKSANPKTLTQHVVGPAKATVTMVEYGDYQCPYCQQYSLTVKAAQTEFKDQIKFQFRNYPLTNLHPNAFAAARAAEAAAQQGKFWDMHDTLYNVTNWQVWTKATDPLPEFNEYAKELGLDVGKFKTAYASSQVNDLINADLTEGTRLGVSGTPAFFVNGKKVDIGDDIGSFEKVIQGALDKQAPASAGTPEQTPATTPPPTQ